MLYTVYGVARRKLLKAGYKFREKHNDFIYDVENLGRFHCKISGKFDRVDIHLDINIGNKHSVFYTPISCKDEVRRIRRY